MNRAELEVLRAWVKAEIEASIADHEEGSDGYYGGGYSERKEAARLFEEFCTIVESIQE